MAALNIEKLVKQYGDVQVVRGLDLKVDEGEMVALLGPSGCGKSTTLRMVAGFVEPTAGQITLGTRDITHLPAHARDTAMVFQSYALFPHMSVAANVGFGLEMRKMPKAQRDARIKTALDMVRLGHLADRLPKQLSGGQQQRVALARALAVNPSILLLDEPLSNLDAKLRAEVQHEIRALQQRLGLTTLIVTHDQEEALIMSDKMVVMEGGVIRQKGTPTELYDQPADTFVAGFIGRCNLITGQRRSAGEFYAQSGAVFACDPTSTGDTLALRPEHITLGAPIDGAPQGKVTRVTYLGAQTEYGIDYAGTSLVVITPSGGQGAQMGQQVGLIWNATRAKLLPHVH